VQVLLGFFPWDQGLASIFRDGLAKIAEVFQVLDTLTQHLQLRGFTFSKLVSFGGGEDSSILTTDQLKEWLGRDRSKSVQPYVQLAKVLREGGEVEKANDILYAG
jgi:hypothetical protein